MNFFHMSKILSKKILVILFMGRIIGGESCKIITEKFVSAGRKIILSTPRPVSPIGLSEFSAETDTLIFESGTQRFFHSKKT